MDILPSLVLDLARLITILYICLGPVDADRFTRDDSQTISVTTIKEKPFLFVEDDSKVGNEKFSGYIPELMEKIKKKTGINYDLRLVPDGKYGSREGSSWSGMIGEVKSGRAQLIAAPMTISNERQEILDFSSPFMSFNTVLLVKKPPSGQENAITSAKDLANQNKVKYGIVAGGSTESFFKTTQNPIFKKMWQEMSKDSSLLVKKVDKGVEKVREGDGNYVFIMEGITAEYWIHQEPCDLMIVEDDIQAKNYGLAMAKRSDLKSKLDPVINELKQNGDLEKLKRKWWDDKSRCETSGSGGLSPVLLAMLANALLALCIT